MKVLQDPLKVDSADYRDGFSSGCQHDFSDPLCSENTAKALAAVLDKHAPKRVKYYWQGYLDGMRTLDRPQKLARQSSN